MKMKRERIAREWDYLSHAILTCATDESIVSLKEDEYMDIVLTVNGHDLPIEKFFKGLEAQHDRMIGERAMELLSNQLREVSNTLSTLAVKLADVEKEVTRQVKDKIQELFPKAEFYWDDEER